MDIRKISDRVMTDTPKYDNVHTLDATQNNPKEQKTVNFRQDYIVIIRKKLYYAISQQDEEKYLRVYQVNNFTNIRTSHNTNGTPSSCSLTIQGGERVICAEREEQDEMGWENWDAMLRGWLGFDNEGGSESGKLWRVGSSKWKLKGADGVDFKNLLKAREAKYGWRFAEKCDWEPMDEVYVFGKTRNDQYRMNNGKGEHQYLQIFFGYIDSVQKTYQAGAGQGLLINISASDQLKLLELSRVTNTPSKLPGVFSGGGIDVMYNFPQDEVGCFAIFDDFYKDAQTNTDNSIYMMIDNVFAGKPPYEIITKLALDAGIPKKYLSKRIEQIERIPFVVRPKQSAGGTGDLFNAELKTRLSVCKEAADKLFLEFFCDEEGNIVLKIPNYALGCNRLPDNNMGLKYDANLIESLGEQITVDDSVDNTKNTVADTKKTTTTNEVKTITYTVVSGDNLTKIAKKFLGDGNLYTEIWHDNYDVIGSNPNLIYPGQQLKIRVRDTSNEKQNEEAQKNIQSDQKKTIDSMLQDKQTKITNGGTLSSKTDQYIPAIKPEYVESFTLIDSDKQIYNMYEIQMETNLFDMSQAVPMAVRRVVPDFDSIVKFGLRPAPGVINTPLISNVFEAEIFGMMMITRSMANRLTGSLQMIEDSSIRVGNPVRFHMYDETPYKETGIFSKEQYPEQAVFYVTGIERNIDVKGVSHMTLQLKAGRMMGQESLFDVSLPLYKYYFEDPLTNFGVFPKLNIQGEPYTVKSTDTFPKIIQNKYGISSTEDKNRYNDILKAIQLLNPGLNTNDQLIVNNIIYLPPEDKIDAILKAANG